MIGGIDATSQSSDPTGLPYPFLSALSRGPRGHRARQVQAVIRDAIVNLALLPGEFIRKNAVCERLGVSRFPVSEALGKLADEGFVEIMPQRGTRVARIDITACRLGMLVRRALEGEAMRILAPRAGDRLIAQLEAILREQQITVQRTDATNFARYDFAFHDLLLSELGYRRVKGVVDAARAKLDRAREFMLRSPERQQQNYLDHLAIVNALKRRNAAAAQRAMTRHLDTAMQEIETRATQNPQIFVPPGETRVAPTPKRRQLRVVS